MKPLVPDDVIRMTQALNVFIDEIGQFLAGFSGGPMPDSTAMAELNSFLRPESVMSAFSQGAILIEVAADQLMTFVKSITEPVQTIAPWTCVRALLEASALATWVLESGISTELRVRRSFAFRFEGLDQQVKWLRVAGKQTDIDKLLKRIEDAEQDALNLGYPKVLDRYGKRIGIGQVMPSVTDIIRDMLDEEATYRLLSAIAHGHHWALSQLGFRLINDNEGENTNWTAVNKSTHLLEKHIEPNSVSYLGLIAVTAFSKSFWCMCQLFGWWNEQSASIFDRLYDSLKIRADLRCWITHRS
jgi:hypothetical protein